MKRPVVLLGSAVSVLGLLSGCGGASASADGEQGKACKAAVTEYFSSFLDGMDKEESPADAMKAFQDAAKDADKKASEACKDLDETAGAEIVAAAQQEAMTKMQSKFSDTADAADADMTGHDMSDMTGGSKMEISGDEKLTDEQSAEVKDAIEQKLKGNG